MERWKSGVYWHGLQKVIDIDVRGEIEEYTSGLTCLVFEIMMEGFEHLRMMIKCGEKEKMVIFV